MDVDDRRDDANANGNANGNINIGGNPNPHANENEVNGDDEEDDDMVVDDDMRYQLEQVRREEEGRAELSAYLRRIGMALWEGIILRAGFWDKLDLMSLDASGLETIGIDNYAARARFVREFRREYNGAAAAQIGALAAAAQPAPNAHGGGGAQSVNGAQNVGGGAYVSVVQELLQYQRNLLSKLHDNRLPMDSNANIEVLFMKLYCYVVEPPPLNVDQMCGVVLTVPGLHQLIIKSMVQDNILIVDDLLQEEQ